MDQYVSLFPILFDKIEGWEESDGEVFVKGVLDEENAVFELFGELYF